MPKIEKKKREVEPAKEAEDVIVKAGNFRIYFQNYYTIISLGNDLLTGGLYFIGSLANLFGAPAIYGQVMYILGGFFLLMRPILKIMHNVFIYNEEQYQEEVKDVGITEGENNEKEDEKKEGREEEDEAYNEGYYGEEEVQEEKKDRIEEDEKEE